MPFRNIVIFFSALFYLLTLTGIGGKAVFCYSSVGSVTVEESENGWSCSPSAKYKKGARFGHGLITGPVFPESSCDPCIDLPLTFTSLVDSPRHLQHASSFYEPQFLNTTLNRMSRTAPHAGNYIVRPFLPARDVLHNSMGNIILLI